MTAAQNGFSVLFMSDTNSIQVGTRFRFPIMFGPKAVKVRSVHTESVTFDNGCNLTWRYLCDLLISGEAIKL